ncbi:NAD-dependent epimerase/dehydratase family protein [Staphylococcus nepalensis]|uniref:NAD-dependent epimerase/dehydratase family protein n=1 Tax=Staphylococcus nepalensis TaxID=214473 RepID=A0ABS3L3Y8_9STAP|nr:NAD-dependent epimerase/dehydratase family protein [Staphylococcus nepalensis]MBO1214790.1 NAD-dependent epimerase/dehydratase family protein [Staphylococcus nepalensis]MBO1228276.1 NAD-dependent epimerase/dehydratase family protein [Staphylococcus nepalensis]MBO1236007.1 NAD-dependent epimerase/dehydratase family protein [Staphylococcus nepalensis]
MKILITGGAGFIGSHLAEYFNENYEVFILDNLSTGHRSNVSFIDETHFIKNDITNKSLIQELINKEKFDIIIHLAAVVSVVETIDNPILSQKVNIDGTLNLLEANKQYNSNLKKFIFASSAAVYGNTELLPQKIESFIDPESPYAIEKYTGEQYTKLYNKLYGLPTTALRFFNIYGPRQDPSSPYSGVLSIMNSKFYHNESFTFFGDGKQTRDFVYIKDLVQAVSIVINCEESNGKIFNLGTGNQLSLLQMFEEFEKIYDKTIDYEFTEPRSGDIKYSYAQIEGLNKLGYNPKYSAQEGLKEYINYTNNA